MWIIGQFWRSMTGLGMIWPREPQHTKRCKANGRTGNITKYEA
jgi:hypothetical protein